MRQIARNLADGVDGFLLDKRFLLLDRDRKHSDAFRHLLEQGGREPLRLAPRHGMRRFEAHGAGGAVQSRRMQGISA